MQRILFAVSGVRVVTMFFNDDWIRGNEDSVRGFFDDNAAAASLAATIAAGDSLDSVPSLEMMLVAAKRCFLLASCVD